MNEISNENIMRKNISESKRNAKVKRNETKTKQNKRKQNKENIIIVILSLYKCLLYMYYVCS